MGILYKNEHLACNDFCPPTKRSFQIFHPQPGLKHNQLDTPRSILLFILEGEIKFSTDTVYNRTLRENEIVLIPAGSNYSIEVKTASRMTSCCFSNDIKLCNRIHLESLSEYKKEHVYNYSTLKIQKEIRLYLSLLNNYLKDDIGCKHLQELKLQELFILFRAYYTKEQLVNFFYPILSQDTDFSHFILSNYRSVMNVEEFAKMANISLSTFNRKFKKYFNESAYQWMLRRKTERVLDDIQNTNKTFLAISLDWNFSSQAHLTKFTKQQCGLSPSQIREQATHSITSD